MAGHSKFKNIMHRKGAQDKKRSNLFSKLSREITVAAKMGMPDPDMNPRLRLAVNAAKAQSMPKDNIQRAIDKASGGDAENYEEVRYEGYGPGGVALIVEALTDNRNRTATNVRTAFSKNGGNLGSEGSVSHGFERRGLIEYSASVGDEEKVLEAAIEAVGQELGDKRAHVARGRAEVRGLVGQPARQELDPAAHRDPARRIARQRHERRVRRARPARHALARRDLVRVPDRARDGRGRARGELARPQLDRDPALEQPDRARESRDPGSDDDRPRAPHATAQHIRPADLSGYGGVRARQLVHGSAASPREVRAPLGSSVSSCASARTRRLRVPSAA